MGRKNESVPQDNPHAAWRMRVAERAAAAYTRNPKLAALTVAGSVGAGLAGLDPPSGYGQAI